MKFSLFWAFYSALLLVSCQASGIQLSSTVNQDQTVAGAVVQDAAAQEAAMTAADVQAANDVPVLLGATATGPAVQATPTLTATSQPTATEPTDTPSASPTQAPTATPTETLTPTIAVEPTATYWPTVTRQVLPVDIAIGLLPCASRTVNGDLLEVVTQQFSLPEYYAPADLVPLSSYFSNDVTRDQELYARAVIMEPLQRMVNDMQAAGLQPSILSVYRSYNEQALAWHWWNGKYPDRVAIMSARPGSSEHQLGTTVDFGSPELDHLFHVDFANTAEGVWLANNAHTYGFTLSFPTNAYPVTGFKYEPWHFRYVGTELAAQLHQSGQILTQWQLTNLPAPCIP